MFDGVLNHRTWTAWGADGTLSLDALVATASGTCRVRPLPSVLLPPRTVKEADGTESYVPLTPSLPNIPGGEASPWCSPEDRVPLGPGGIAAVRPFALELVNPPAPGTTHESIIEEATIRRLGGTERHARKMLSQGPKAGLTHEDKDALDDARAYAKLVKADARGKLVSPTEGAPSPIDLMVQEEAREKVDAILAAMAARTTRSKANRVARRNYRSIRDGYATARDIARVESVDEGNLSRHLTDLDAELVVECKKAGIEPPDL